MFYSRPPPKPFRLSAFQPSVFAASVFPPLAFRLSGCLALCLEGCRINPGSYAHIIRRLTQAEGGRDPQTAPVFLVGHPLLLLCSLQLASRRRSIAAV
jgi:hypothetical protein